jgi:hypothetical protein
MYSFEIILVSNLSLVFALTLQVVTAVQTATVPSTTWKKQIKKQTMIATTKLFPVTSVKPSRSSEAPQTKSRGGISKESARTLRPNRSSYLWQFPDLSGDSLQDEDLDEVHGAVLELKKEKTS